MIVVKQRSFNNIFSNIIIYLRVRGGFSFIFFILCYLWFNNLLALQIALRGCLKFEVYVVL